MKRRQKMPYIITTALYPSDKATDVAKRYLEAINKYPPDDSLGTTIVPAAVIATLQGIKVLTITDVKKGKLEDAQTRWANILAMFHNIHGYESSMETYMKIEEAMGVIGMSLPV
jgi:hypothetical protein